jgi:RHS repeat-associated protein
MFNYTYDDVGNRLIKTDDTIATTYIYDANDRLLTESDNTYIYDYNGNTLRKINSTDVASYSYDFQNRLVQANITDSSGNSVLDYVYDVDGIRNQKKVNGTDVTNYLSDKNQPFAQVLLETDGVGANVVSYVYGDDLISQNRSGSLSYYYYDGQMSTRKLLDDPGLVTDSYVYDAYGILLNQTGSTVNNYLYTGEQYDPNVGFYYLRARMYNPSIGRFMTIDMNEGSPYDPSTLHKYLYSANNPINMVDPSGQLFIEVSISLSIQSIINSYIFMLFSTLISATYIADDILEPGYALYYKSFDLIIAGHGTPGVWKMLATSKEQIAKGYILLSKAIGQNLKKFAFGLFFPIKISYGQARRLLTHDINMILADPKSPSSWAPSIEPLKRLREVARSGFTFMEKVSENPSDKGKIHSGMLALLTLIKGVLPRE